MKEICCYLTQIELRTEHLSPLHQKNDWTANSFMHIRDLPSTNEGDYSAEKGFTCFLCQHRDRFTCFMDEKVPTETLTGYGRLSLGFYFSLALAMLAGGCMLPASSSCRADSSRLCLFYLTRATLVMYIRWKSNSQLMMLFFYTCPNLSCNNSCILLLDEAVSCEIHESISWEWCLSRVWAKSMYKNVWSSLGWERLKILTLINGSFSGWV